MMTIWHSDVYVCVHNTSCTFIIQDGVLSSVRYNVQAKAIKLEVNGLNHRVVTQIWSSLWLKSITSLYGPFSCWCLIFPLLLLRFSTCFLYRTSQEHERFICVCVIYSIEWFDVICEMWIMFSSQSKHLCVGCRCSSVRNATLWWWRVPVMFTFLPCQSNLHQHT